MYYNTQAMTTTKRENIMTNKVNVIDFEEIEASFNDNQAFGKTSKRDNRAAKHGDKELVRNCRKMSSKRKGRMTG